MEDADRLLDARVLDACVAAEQKDVPRFVGFLNEFEQARALCTAQKAGFRYRLWGGYAQAERRIFAALPSWATEDFSDFPIQAVTVHYKPIFQLTHRDFLGALMALGIVREKVGDILVADGYAVVFLHRDILEYVYAQLKKVGAVGVQLTVGWDPAPFTARFEDIRTTVASARLDCVVAALLHTSREKAAALIRGSSVLINSCVCIDVSKRIGAETVLTVSKTGKFIIDDVSGQTKKGRVVLLARKKI